MSGDRPTLWDLEAEEGVFGCILLDREVLGEVIPLLTAEDFYRDAHQVIYRAVCELHDLGRTVDLITLADELTRREEIETIGGEEFLAKLVRNVRHAADAKRYAAIVREKSLYRQMRRRSEDR
jgi:replicative DNA helicase